MSGGKPTEFGLWPTNITPSELTTVLLNGAEQGITDFFKDPQSPSFNFDWSSLEPLLNAAYTFGLIPTKITNPLDSLSNLVELDFSEFASLF
jgi:hypothetical protein